MKDAKIYFAKTSPDGIIPSKRKEDAGYDIYTTIKSDFVLLPNETHMFSTGIATALPTDFYLELKERGSTANYGLSLRAGVIDSGYRGEIFVALTNTSNKNIIFSKTKDAHIKDNIAVYSTQKAICQAVLRSVFDAEEIEIPYEDLKAIKSERGCGKMGSSGK